MKVTESDIDFPANCLCLNVRKAARAITRVYDEAIQPTGLRATQLSILFMLSLRGEMPISELAQRLVMDRTTLSRNLRPLEKEGLVSVAHGSDRRMRIVELTPNGQEILEEARPFWAQVQRRFAEHMGGEQWERMLADLRSVISGAR